MRDGKHLILCIDDDPDILFTLRIMLEQEGFAVETAASAEDGLRCFRRQAPDALIVDLMMEEVDAGTSLVRDLKALGNVAPVFMLSSAGDNLSMATDYSSLGLAGVFQKPMSRERLVGMLRAKLG
ncbi:MAG: response regulator [Candidatus Krumholzibacteriia bacterium]|nr:response regulator [bacterium]MCB9514458.1 response regulator [Candidatus Latescibacterota bacterium]MCB9517262.1 response regulator [Candidatus Latescibacterota bacterium]